jgi:hypothetical protein
MTNPRIIGEEIIDLMLSIPGMNALLPNGAAMHVEAEGNREKAVGAMKMDSALLVWDGMSTTSDGGGEVYQHDYRLYVRLSETGYADFLTAWHDGVPADGDGQPMIYNSLPSVSERIELVQAQSVVGADFADYLEIYFTVLDRQG